MSNQPLVKHIPVPTSQDRSHFVIKCHESTTGCTSPWCHSLIGKRVRGICSVTWSGQLNVANRYWYLRI